MQMQNGAFRIAVEIKNEKKDDQRRPRFAASYCEPTMLDKKTDTVWFPGLAFYLLRDKQKLRRLPEFFSAPSYTKENQSGFYFEFPSHPSYIPRTELSFFFPQWLIHSIFKVISTFFYGYHMGID